MTPLLSEQLKHSSVWFRLLWAGIHVQKQKWKMYLEWVNASKLFKCLHSLMGQNCNRVRLQPRERKCWFHSADEQRVDPVQLWQGAQWCPVKQHRHHGEFSVHSLLPPEPLLNLRRVSLSSNRTFRCCKIHLTVWEPPCGNFPATEPEEEKQNNLCRL